LRQEDGKHKAVTINSGMRKKKLTGNALRSYSMYRRVSATYVLNHIGTFSIESSDESGIMLFDDNTDATASETSREANG
jgi:hypothetical protein